MKPRKSPEKTFSEHIRDCLCYVHISGLFTKHFVHLNYSEKTQYIKLMNSEVYYLIGACRVLERRVDNRVPTIQREGSDWEWGLRNLIS